MGKIHAQIRDMGSITLIALAVIISIPAILAGCLMDIGDIVWGKLIRQGK